MVCKHKMPNTFNQSNMKSIDVVLKSNAPVQNKDFPPPQKTLALNDQYSMDLYIRLDR